MPWQRSRPLSLLVARKRIGPRSECDLPDNGAKIQRVLPRLWPGEHGCQENGISYASKTYLERANRFDEVGLWRWVLIRPRGRRWVFRAGLFSGGDAPDEFLPADKPRF